MSSTVAVTDVVRQRELRRMKGFATGLLVLAAAVFIVARANEDGPAWVGYVEAFAEAAMVGALADWFAVTALFRYPLGIPIPHTAIIPRRKDQIGRSLGEFVQNHFLTKEVLTERLHGAHVGRRLGLWLREPENAERATAAIADAMRGTIEVLDDRDVQDAIGGLVQRRLEDTPVAPLVGKAIDVAVEGGHHQRLLDAVLTGLASFLEDNRATLRVAPRRGIAVVDPGAGRRPHLPEALPRGPALPRRRRWQSGPRRPGRDRRTHPPVRRAAAQ